MDNTIFLQEKIKELIDTKLDLENKVEIFGSANQALQIENEKLHKINEQCDNSRLSIKIYNLEHKLELIRKIAEIYHIKDILDIISE